MADNMGRKAIMISFNLKKDRERTIYERLQDCNDGTFSSMAAYAKYLIVNQLNKSDDFIEEMADEISSRVVEKISGAALKENIPDYVNEYIDR